MTRTQDAPAEDAAPQDQPTPKVSARAGGNGSAAKSGGTSIVGGLTTAAGSGLPLPRSELLLAGKSIVRCMRRVTHGADPRGKGEADATQLLGDAARIGALASILDPNAGLATLVTAGAPDGEDGAEAPNPKAIVELLRLHFGQLGYMQGVLDENVCQLDGQLEGLAGSGEPPADAEMPADLAAATADELGSARSAWAARADLDFDALIWAQEAMNDLDDRRRNLDHQVDALSGLLAGLDDAGATLMPRHLGDTLCYGLGWHLAGDSKGMASALRESRAQIAATPRTAPIASAAPPAVVAAPATAPTPAPAKPRGVPFAEWASANKIDGGRLAVLQALAGLQRWCGFYDALTGTLGRELVELRSRADKTSARRRALSAEVQRRTLAAETPGS
jgi:hypothetical protein